MKSDQAERVDDFARGAKPGRAGMTEAHPAWRGVPVVLAFRADMHDMSNQ